MFHALRKRNAPVCLVTPIVPGTPGQSVETRLFDLRTPSCRLFFVLNPFPEACPALCCPHFLGPFPPRSLHQAPVPGAWLGPPFPVLGVNSCSRGPVPWPCHSQSQADPSWNKRLSQALLRTWAASPLLGLPPSLGAQFWTLLPAPLPHGLQVALSRDLPSSEDPQCPWDLVLSPSSRVTGGPVSPESRVQDNRPSPPPSSLPYPNHRDARSAAVLSPGLGTSLAQSSHPSLWAGSHYRIWSLWTSLSSTLGFQVAQARIRLHSFPCTVPQAAMLWRQLFSCGSSRWKLLT